MTEPLLRTDTGGVASLVLAQPTLAAATGAGWGLASAAPEPPLTGTSRGAVQ